MERRERGMGTVSASFIAAARACRMSARNSEKSLHPSLKSERLSLRRTVSLTRYRPPDKAWRRLARNLAKSTPASLQSLTAEISSARYRSLGRVALDRMMAADEIERADKAAVTPAIAQAAFDPALAVAEEFQQQIEDFHGFRRVMYVHNDASG